MTEFPLTGTRCRVDYGDLAVEHDFRAEGKLSYTTLAGPMAGYGETVDIVTTEIAPDVHLVRFQDAAASVVLVENLAEHVVHTVMSLNTGEVVQLRGELTIG